MKIFKYLLLTLLVFSFVSPSLAEDLPELNNFHTIYEPNIPSLSIPTVVGLSLDSKQKYGIAVIEEGNPLPQAWEEIYHYSNPLKVLDHSAILGEASNLIDNNYRTYTEFDLDKDSGQAYLILESAQEFTSNSLNLNLEDKVSLPRNIAISAWIDENWKTVKAFNTLGYLSNTYVDFPETKAQKWKIEFKYDQPLRLNGISFNELLTENSQTVEYRWLARPNKSYKIYADAESSVYLKTAEVGDLRNSNLEVLNLGEADKIPNPEYTDPDTDQDLIIDKLDNCPFVANPDQEDIDENGKGDACEDFDGDGISNLKDNCRDYANYTQADEDNDGIGDICDDEESRLTERMPWLPWAAMGLAALLLIVILVQTLKSQKPE